MATIVLKTPIPGPRSKEWLHRLKQAVPTALHPAIEVMVAKAEGAVITDWDGNTLIDLAGGIGCLNTGHAHPQVVEAIQAQARRFTHTDFSLLPYDGYIRLAERLAEKAPIRGTKRVAFFNSGAEAVENAVKIARKATGRAAIISFEGGFHGRTLMALTLTGRATPYKEGFGPFAPEVYRMPYPDRYRHHRPEQAGLEALEAIERGFRTQVSPKQVAAIIVEPVQGEGGFIVPPKDFLRGLRDICDRHGIVLIVDEIQSGYGRTGRFFALEHFELEADLMTAGKSIASGMPLSAVIGREDLMNAVPQGGVGGTTIGNPIACAAGLAVLDVMDQENLTERARHLGERLRSFFGRLKDQVPSIGDVRGLGAMIGVELVEDRKTKKPAQAWANQATQAIVSRGVIPLTAGLYGNVLRFLTPLVIEDYQLDEALDVVGDVLANSDRSGR